MSDNILPPDSEDTAIIDKFNELIGKHENRGVSSNPSNRMNAIVPARRSEGSGSHAAPSSAIPMLTEIVTLRPSIIQPQPKRSTPMQKLLDAALSETGITMSSHDKKALANALESHLLGKSIIKPARR